MKIQLKKKRWKEKEGEEEEEEEGEGEEEKVKEEEREICKRVKMFLVGGWMIQQVETRDEMKRSFYKVYLL